MGPTGSSQWITSGNNIYYNNANVGINNSNPSSTLDVSGNIKSNTINSSSIIFPNAEISQNATTNDVIYNIYTNTTHRFNTANGAGGSILTIDNGSIYYFRPLNNGSDDRIKKNESLIENATSTLMKLRPEIYDKYQTFDCSGNFFRESGIIVQETYYNCPELRHLIKIPKDAHDLTDFVPNSIDPNQDPVEYSKRWGTEIAAINYTGFIPYLIKSNQEQQILIDNLLARISVLENK
jgi:hypothetical protein